MWFVDKLGAQPARGGGSVMNNPPATFTKPAAQTPQAPPPQAARPAPTPQRAAPPAPEPEPEKKKKKGWF